MINAIIGKYPMLSISLKVNFRPKRATPIRSIVPEANSIPALQFFSLFKNIKILLNTYRLGVLGILYFLMTSPKQCR